MYACTFFGHRDCPDSIALTLTDVLIDLIENHSVHTFYVGTHGKFDKMVLRVLQSLALSHPNISYSIVLAYLPTSANCTDNVYSVLPENIEKVPPRFAIHYRNRWIINHSDYAVTYITHSWGGAARFAEIAKRKHLNVINLPDVFN